VNTNTTKNGQPRKSLSEQIDRLDSVIDALAVGLNEAVATVVQEAVAGAVERAVKAALVEVLTNPSVLEHLRPAAAAAQVAPVAARPSLWARVVQKGRQVLGKAAGAARWCWAQASACARAACRSASTLGSALLVRLVLLGMLANQHRKPVAVAAVAGVAVGVACYMAGPGVASALCGVAGFAAALVGGAWRKLRGVMTGQALSA
jgi:hypothetical protein